MLKYKNQKLEQESNNLMSYIKTILKAVKYFFKELLQIGNEKVKERTIEEIKEYFDQEDFDKSDIYDIAKDTTKEDELFDYADIDKRQEKEKDFDIEL